MELLQIPVFCFYSPHCQRKILIHKHDNISPRCFLKSVLQKHILENFIFLNNFVIKLFFCFSNITVTIPHTTTNPLSFLFLCKISLKQYVGQNFDTFRHRWNNYKVKKGNVITLNHVYKNTCFGLSHVQITIVSSLMFP